MIAHSDRDHAKLSASGSHRWITCTPSANLESKMPRETSSYADEGTHAHEYLENELRYRVLGSVNKTRYIDIKNDLSENKYFSSEVAEGAEAFLAYIANLGDIYSVFGGDPLTIHTEQRLNFSQWVPDGFGTGDLIMLSKTVLDVVDYKFGKGVKVNAHKNEQLMIYGLGALSFHQLAAKDVDTIRLHIVQPRLNHFDTYILSKEDLLAWAVLVLKPAADLAYAGKGAFVTGDHCRFCKVKHSCKALANESLNIARTDFSNNLLNDSEIIELYSKLENVLSWANAVSDFVETKAKNGHKWDGYKLVAGKSNRRITDPKAVAQHLHNLGYDPKKFVKTSLEGIGKLESLVGKKDFYSVLGQWIEKPLGAPTLVPESDSRPEYAVHSAEADFKEK